jgi:hypothetical protein
MGRASPGLVATVLGFLAGQSCLPTDTREPPGSILLMVTSADEPSVTTADGWSITVDRLLLGMGDANLGDANLGRNESCTRYSTSFYRRLLDARSPGDQKLSIMYGLGRCHFYFNIVAPSYDALLGEGVTEADKDRMAGPEFAIRGRVPEGIAIDLAATATRGPETKRVHWKFGRDGARGLTCGVPPEPSQPIELQRDVNLTFHIGIRGAALFGDDANPNTATLRFDAIAAADTTYGNNDGEITLDELGGVSLDFARRHGPYRIAARPGDPPGPPVPGTQKLKDYVNRELLPSLVRMREDITCRAQSQFVPPAPPVRDAAVDEGGLDEGGLDEGGLDEDGADE